jgi:hypothetical protein
MQVMMPSPSKAGESTREQLHGEERRPLHRHATVAAVLILEDDDRLRSRRRLHC